VTGVQTCALPISKITKSRCTIELPLTAQDEQTCIIEAMKTFNEIEAEISGKIVKVLVDNATPVDYDQPLFLVDPS
jgi:glycine cleavage system H lipoate-binding protein